MDQEIGPQEESGFSGPVPCIRQERHQRYGSACGTSDAGCYEGTKLFYRINATLVGDNRQVHMVVEMQIPAEAGQIGEEPDCQHDSYSEESRYGAAQGNGVSSSGETDERSPSLRRGFSAHAVSR